MEYDKDGKYRDHVIESRKAAKELMRNQARTGNSICATYYNTFGLDPRAQYIDSLDNDDLDDSDLYRPY